MRKLPVIALLGLVLAVGLLLALSLQYPLSTSFPMGGDAAFYVNTAQQLIHPTQGVSRLHLLTNSWYPLSHLIFASFVILPLSWPLRFIWWAAIGQIAVGLALGWLAFRLNGWASAATAMAIWALTPVDFLNHFESATIAQLWSLLFFVIFLERVFALDWLGAPLLLGLTALAHPITGFTTLLAVALSLIPLWLTHRQLQPAEKYLVYALTVTVVVAIAGILTVLSIRQGVTNHIVLSSQNISPLDYVRSIFNPFILIAPVGFWLVLRKLRQQTSTLYIWLSVVFTAILLVFNNLLGIGLITQRLQSPFIILVSICAAVALPYILYQTFKVKLWRWLFVVLLFSGLGYSVWADNHRIYAWQEFPGNYAHLHPGEYAALIWIKTNLPPGSTIVASDINRHSEWIAPLSGERWLPLRNTAISIDSNISGVPNVKGLPPASYLLLLPHREKIPEMFKVSTPDFPILYQTKDALLVQLVAPL